MMKPVTTTFCIAAAVAACSLSAVASAEDLRSAMPSKDPGLAVNIDHDIKRAAAGSTAVDPASGDLDSRIKDLEATRAAGDQGKTPAVSLSVSGWVSQQVQYNIKQ
ncbi:hypothetical protein [Hyphomicrobium sp. ghe19]|uniref:hypothetical protein n=1 Tax=Hyphomicrobium sp. ghe19 TaxID=2682968 RepID=UPI0030D4ABD7